MKHIELNGPLMKLNEKLRKSEFIELSDWGAPTKIVIDIQDWPEDDRKKEN